MKSRQALWTGILSAAAMLLIILDAKTALSGANEGVIICLRTVIPSLYPFFFLSNLICMSLSGQDTALLRPVGRLCGIPRGSESVLILGMIGGYPVGARSVNQLYQNGRICKKDAERMLGFCNNAGPAFIFGMVAGLFSSPLIPFALFAIQITTAICVAAILPNKSSALCRPGTPTRIDITGMIEQSSKTMAIVCGWVILFRIVIAFAQRWFFWLLTPIAQAVFVGLMELSNGCLALQEISCESTRFIFCACFLSLGGLCVMLQTISVIGDLNVKYLIIGKSFQCFFSLILSGILQYFIFADHIDIMHIPTLVIAGVASAFILILFMYRNKKVVAFRC